MTNTESARSSSCTKNGQERAKTETYSLLSLLDDKNKTIATLQKQLQNQKAQLSYYLKKELRAPTIARLSESCSPRAPQESMVVNMAMNKFGKPLGIKTTLCTTYERMCIVDDRISACLQDQEFILRKIVNKLCEFVKYANGKIEFKVQFSNFITDPFHIELFDKLLCATVHLRRKLDTFRICCNRLLVIEDERNSIVEQIYSLPVDQRMNSNYILGIQTEKIQLEKELKQILKDQIEDKERIKELNIIEEKLSTLQQTYRINKMLQKVNFEAKVLLDLTKEQRRKYEKEVLNAKSQKNVSLERILRYIRMAMEGRQPEAKDLIKNGVESKEDLAVFECIKKEIDSGRDKILGKVFDELQAKRKDCDDYTSKLNQAVLEKNELKIANIQLQRDISEIKLNQCKDLSKLKQERDAFKSQVEDLEAIREAYAQLVDRQPSASRLEGEYLEQIGDMDKQINELEKLNMNLSQKMNAMKMVINKQKRELKMQNEVIDDLREQTEKNYEVKNTKKPNHICGKTSTDDSGVYNSSPRDTILTDDFAEELSFGEVYEEEIFVEQINWIEEQQYHSPLQATQISPSPKCDNSGDRKYSEERKKIVENIKNHIMAKTHDPGNGSPTKWLSTKDKSDVDIIELAMKGDLEENIDLEKFPFDIDFNCKSKESGDEGRVKEVDEYNLLKDSTQGSTPVCVPKKKSTKVAVENEVCKRSKSKKVEVLANFNDKMSSESSDDHMKQSTFANVECKEISQ